MNPEIKDQLYRELMNILLKLESNEIPSAILELEDLLNRISYNRL